MESLLDSTDLEIINILRENARLSLREIARRLGKSVMTVQRRLKKMEKMGIIKGYTIVVDKDKLGFKCGVCALVRVKTGFDPAIVGEEIAKIDMVESVNLVTGDYELTIIANCRDNKEAYHLLKKNLIDRRRGKSNIPHSPSNNKINGPSHICQAKALLTKILN